MEGKWCSARVANNCKPWGWHFAPDWGRPVSPAAVSGRRPGSFRLSRWVVRRRGGGGESTARTVVLWSDHPRDGIHFHPPCTWPYIRRRLVRSTKMNLWQLRPHGRCLDELDFLLPPVSFRRLSQNWNDD